MPALSLRYDCCARRKPYYLNKSEIETVAREARAQLVSPGADALTLEQLAAISDLTIQRSRQWPVRPEHSLCLLARMH